MRVTRRRRSTADLSPNTRLLRRGIAGATIIALSGGGLAAADSLNVFGTQKVGQEYAKGLQISSNQMLKPYGDRLVTKYGKFMGTTVSRDGRFLAASSNDRNVTLQIFDTRSNSLIFTVGKHADAKLKTTDMSVGQESPTYSPDGKFLWLAQADGVTRFPVNADGTLSAPTTFKLAKVGDAQALPAAMTYAADGKTLYVAVNGQNSVVALDPATGTVRQTWDVGIAPRQITVIGKKLYVSNEGGHRARPGETTINSYGTDTPANAFLGTSTSGTVSVIDTAKPEAAVGSIDVGLHPTAMKQVGNALFVANTNSDTVSVVDIRKNRVVQTINTQPYASSKVGYHPTGIAMTADGHLLVTLGRANAVAVYRYAGTPQEPVKLIGLLPTDYYPEDVHLIGNRVVIANRRGIDARGEQLSFDKGKGTTKVTGLGTHSTTASLTAFTMPDDKAIKKATKTVFEQNAWGKHDVELAAAKKAKPVPVPHRVGDPSTIKHVFLLVKENRTYDQLHGDDPRGDSDPKLAQFGEQVTPNIHALSHQFGLYDNVYDTGTNSAEGHNWVMQGDNPEYTESSAGEYIRSYDTEDDVLGHQRSGFLWTSVMAAGAQGRNFGEFVQFLKKPEGATWQKYYCAAKAVEKGASPDVLVDPSIKTDNQSPIPSLNAITVHEAPKFDTNIPDIYRYQIWKRDFDKQGPANLNMVWLSSDHTGGPTTPRSAVADGDLATGKIVDTISHSKYWKDSVIFVVEDDSQNGADHVDGHRAPIQVISPWAAHNKVVSTYYTQINMVRTIQQILGAQPLNQKLAAATPMYDAFQATPDLTPYTAVPNKIPLTEDIKVLPECGADTLGQTLTPAAAAKASTVTVPADKQALAAQWEAWRKGQPFVTQAKEDSAPPAMMERYTWYATHAWTTPYPGDTKVYAPKDVPGGTIPNADQD